MRGTTLILAILLLAGCPPQLGDDDDAANDDDAAGGCPEQAEWLPVDDPGRLDVADAVGGDWSCNREQEDPIEGLTDVVQTSLVEFLEGGPIPAGRVSIWLDGEIDGAPDHELESGADGALAFEVTACTLVAARNHTEFNPPETYPTLQHGIAAIPGSGLPVLMEPLLSVAYSTYNLLPLTIGVEPIPGRAHVFGRVLDCGSAAVAGAELSLGRIEPDTGCVTENQDVDVRYFVDFYPDSREPWTDEEGGFAVLNLDPDEPWDLLAWGRPAEAADCLTRPDGSPTWSPRNPELCLVARADLFGEADAATIRDVAARPLPAACY